MKVAVIGTTSDSVIGFRSSFIKKLVENGHTVYALATDYTSKKEYIVKELGATPVSYPLSRYGINPFVDILNTLRLMRILRRLNADIAFSYFVKPVIFGTIAAKLAGVLRCVGMLEGLGYAFTEPPNGRGFKHKLIKITQVFLYKVSIPFLSRLILLNHDDRNDLVFNYSIKAKDVAILGGIGLDLNQYPYQAPKEKEEINFTFVGRLLMEKGISYFLDSAEIVKDIFPNATFTICGGTESENPSPISLERLNKLCDKKVVKYTGQVSNIQHYLGNCSVFVLPSYYREGCPRSTQEAMAIGRPVITTDVPGCRQTVENGRNGLLIPPHNVKALVEAMTFFIQNPEQIEKMGLESYKIVVEKFDVDKVNEKLYQLVTDQKP